MQIYLNHIAKDEEVILKLKIEHSTPMHDLFVAFISHNEVCGLENGKESDPYDEFYFRSVSHIIEATTEYENVEHHLTIGYYVSSGSFVPFLINQSSELREHIFDSSTLYDENYHPNFLLFNYREYAQLQEVGLEKLSFEEYVKKLVTKHISHEQNTLYNIKKNGNDNFTSHKGFWVFLEEQKK